MLTHFYDTYHVQIMEYFLIWGGSADFGIFSNNGNKSRCFEFKRSDKSNTKFNVNFHNVILIWRMRKKVVTH